MGGFAILFYAVHPVAVRTTMWLSDRFDLMATASVFAARAVFASDGYEAATVGTVSFDA